MVFFWRMCSWMFVKWHIPNVTNVTFQMSQMWHFSSNVTCRTSHSISQRRCINCLLQMQANFANKNKFYMKIISKSCCDYWPGCDIPACICRERFFRFPALLILFKVCELRKFCAAYYLIRGASVLSGLPREFESSSVCASVFHFFAKRTLSQKYTLKFFFAEALWKGNEFSLYMQF